MDLSQKITVITGHYGVGKTNLTVNIALYLQSYKLAKPIAVADLDIVNPFFRTADFKELFSGNGVMLAASDYVGTSLDIPALNIDIKAVLHRCGRLIIDVGGDGEGAKALGRFASVIKEYGYDMLYVINRYRYVGKTSEQSAVYAADVLKSIEHNSGLKCSAIVNNSNLGKETTDIVIAESADFANEVLRLTGLPLLQIPVKVYVKPIWDV